jgi:hypothetical protein
MISRRRANVSFLNTMLQICKEHYISIFVLVCSNSFYYAHRPFWAMPRARSCRREFRKDDMMPPLDGSTARCPEERLGEDPHINGRSVHDSIKRAMLPDDSLQYKHNCTNELQIMPCIPEQDVYLEPSKPPHWQGVRTHGYCQALAKSCHLSGRTRVPKNPNAICRFHIDGEEGFILVRASMVHQYASITCADERCALCGGRLRHMLRCSICRTPYCDQTCQSIDWPEHQLVCKRGAWTAKSIIYHMVEF